MGRFFGFGMHHTYARLGRPSRLPSIQPTRLTWWQRLMDSLRS